MDEHKTCGRCGVYRDMHPTDRCTKPRRSFWWDRHRPIGHVVGTVWLALPERWRWAYVNRYDARHPGLCWCDLVTAVMLRGRKGDYRRPWGCGCDVPVPWEVGEPEPGRCYCPPREVSRGGV